MWGAAAYAVVSLVALASSFSGSKRAVSQKLQAFADKYKAVRIGMSEKEVDGLLSRYSSSEKYGEAIDATSTGAFPRPSKWAKSYLSGYIPGEGAYIIRVYFDDGCLVVGVEFIPEC
jgi:hypothetical protein